MSRAYYAAYFRLRDMLRPQLPDAVNFGAHERVIHIVRKLVVQELQPRVADVVEQYAIDLDAARQARVDADYRLQDTELRAPIRRAALLKQLVLVRPLVREAPTIATAVLNAAVPPHVWVSFTGR